VDATRRRTRRTSRRASMAGVAGIFLEFVHALSHHVIASRIDRRSLAHVGVKTNEVFGARVLASDARADERLARAFSALFDGVAEGDVRAVCILVRERGVVIEEFAFVLDIAPAAAPTEENKSAVKASLATLATWFVFACDSLAPATTATRTFEVIARAKTDKCPNDWRAEEVERSDARVEDGAAAKSKRVRNDVFELEIVVTMKRRA